MDYIDINLIDTYLKFIILNICICYTYLRITNYGKLCTSQKVILLIANIILTLLECIITYYVPKLVRTFLIYLSYSYLLSKITSYKYGYSMIATVICLAICYLNMYFTSFIVFTITVLFTNIEYNNPFVIVLINILELFFITRLFKIKRIKNGFPFFKNMKQNEYVNIFILFINIIVIFVYFLTENFINISIAYTTGIITVITILMIITLHQTFILYQKHKLQTQALEDYKQELSEAKEKLAIAIEEKNKLVKSNHEFYHRQEALNKKLDDLINNQKLSMNSEFGGDFGDILDRINSLSDEYITKTSILPMLEKTNIVEIDDMLSYMQSECDKNNIEFTLKINCDVKYIIENFISKSQLETLLGDLIRNSIIAVNHSSNDYRSIMVMFGIKDDSYELCILDSGIPFEIDTLISLGLRPSSTHLDEGGSGIGFITTFETLKSCRASFVVNEITNNNYTKSLEIKFDNRNEYIVISNRTKDINKKNNGGRNIILKDSF